VQAQVTVRPVNLSVLRMVLFSRHCSFTMGLYCKFPGYGGRGHAGIIVDMMTAF